MLEGVRRMLEAVENCALYAVGTAGNALCAEVLQVVFSVLEVLKRALYTGLYSESCRSGWRLCSMC